ncbi:MAG TPA: hypothetical protein VGK30_07435 [Candidatus Binatia bacterium]|jgi:hypothetical protein
MDVPAPTGSEAGERTATPRPTGTPGAPTAVGTSFGSTPAPTATDTESTPAPTDGAGPTPTATPAPVAATVRVDFTITTGEALLGFQFTVLYPTASGSFTGSGAHVACPLGASGIFVKNDQDDGHLILAAIDLSPYPSAFNLSCTFDVAAGHALMPADIGVTGTEVTRPDGTMGDPSKFAVAVGVN